MELKNLNTYELKALLKKEKDNLPTLLIIADFALLMVSIFYR